MPTMAPYGDNPHNVTVKPLEFDAEGSPDTKTYHGSTIVVDNNIVGKIQSWNVQIFNRGGTHIYELSWKTFGRPVDYVPGTSTGYTASISRVEVWGKEIEIALGFSAVFDDLADQTRAWTTQEFIYRGYDVYRLWEYRGCWFQDRNEDAFSADGDAVVRLNATVAFVSRKRII